MNAFRKRNLPSPKCPEIFEVGHQIKYRRGSDEDSDCESVAYDNSRLYERKRRSCACIVLKWTAIVFAILLVLLFLTIFVIIPIVFMESIELQRKLMFPNFDQPENPQYTNYALYGAEGVHNRYITVDDILDSSASVSLGVWQVVPEEHIEDAEKPGYDFDKALEDSDKPICIYFHGNSGTRIYPYPTYQRLRKYFHVLAVDYRSYGDSTEALLTEKAVVSDLAQFYKKILEMTKKRKQDVYFWAHSLGTALSTHTLRKITEEAETSIDKYDRLPRALMLEAPFTTMGEEIANHPIGKIFAWLPWFDATIRDPLIENGFHFYTTTNILKVKCPIMIVHAMDDSIIPYTLGEKLAKVAMTERDLNVQGNVTLHIIPANARCDHMNINTYVPLEQFISDFLEGVKDWYSNHK